MNKFKEIFSGLTIAYGQYQKGDRGSNGKLKGKAFIVRKTLLINYGKIILMVNHLLWGSSLLLKIAIVGGGVLILTNITLTILASYKVFVNLISH